MAQIEVGARIQVDASLADKSLKDLQQELKDSQKALNEAKLGSDDFAQAQQRVQEATENLNKVTGQQQGAFSTLKEKIFETVPALKGAEAGASSFGTALKALAMNPIVLLITGIVLALKGLYDAFTSTMSGAQKVEQIFQGLSQVVDVIKDRLVTFGNAVIKLFTGDIAGAAADAKKAFSGVGDEIATVYNRTVEITKKLQQIRKEERTDELERSQREKRLALLREQLNDESLAAKEKLKIAKELRDDQIKNAEDDKRRTIEKSDLEIEKIRMKKNLTEEDYNKINELEIAKNKVETENALEGVRANRVIRNLKRQMHSEEVAELEAIKAKNKEVEEAMRAEAEKTKNALKIIQDAEDKTNEEDRKYQIEKIKREYQEKADIVAKAGLSTMKIWQAYDKERKTLEAKWKKEDDTKEKERKEKEIQDAKIAFDKQQALIQKDIDLAREAAEKKKEIAQKEFEAKQALREMEAGALTALVDIIGRNTAAGKAIAVAQATISTYSAAQKAYESQLSVPSPDAPIRGAIAAASAVLMGVAKIKQILAVQIPGHASGGSAPSTGSPAAPMIPRAPQGQSTTLSQSSISALNATTARAYVVESDITNSQQRISRINRAARLA